MTISIPPFSTVPAPGDPVASAWAQQLTQFAVDQISSGPTPPTNPDAELWYDTSDMGLSLPNNPRGQMGYKIGTTGDQTGILAATDVAGLTVTWVASPDRVYRIQCGAYFVQNTAAGFVQLLLTNDANSIRRQTAANVLAGISSTLHVVNVETGLSGSQTRKARMMTNAGTLTVSQNNGTQGYLLVEDIGGV